MAYYAYSQPPLHDPSMYHTPTAYQPQAIGYYDDTLPLSHSPYYSHHTTPSHGHASSSQPDYAFDAQKHTPVSMSTRHQVPYEKMERHNGCLDCFCLGCCTCCPKWIRWLSCFLLLIIVALAITVGVLAATFKKPDVKLNGLENEPQFALNGTVADFAFNLNLTVDNPNIESVTFENVKAQAYYPAYSELLGGGSLNNVYIAANNKTNIIFPFTLAVDASQPSTRAILADILSKCGITGSTPQNIVIDYTVTPTLRVLGLPISISFSNNAQFSCPSQINDLASEINGLGTLIHQILGTSELLAKHRFI